MAPRREVIARDTGDRFRAPTDNSALQLARALAQINPEIDRTLGVYAQQQQEKYAVQAAEDAYRTQGKAYADAVRDGELEPTQNPWYMQAYATEAAAVSGKAALNDLRTQSLQWEERTDSAAFEARWREEVAAVGESYTGTDAQRGFGSARDELTQQVLNENVGFNVRRIQEERLANMGTLLADRISSLNLERGNAPPGAYYEHVADLRESFIGTGGTEGEWRELFSGAITTAAYGQNDASLLDVLRHDTGEGSYYNVPGAADKIENDRFRIENAVERQRTARSEARYQQIKNEGIAALDAAYNQYGTDLLTGALPVNELVEDLRGQGYSPQAIAYALDDVQRSVSDLQSLNEARLTAPGAGGSTRALDLFVQASTEGYSEELEGEIAREVLSGTIKESEGVSYLRAAFEQSRRNGQSASGGFHVSSASALRTTSNDLGEIAALEIRDTFNLRVSDTAIQTYKSRIRASAMRVVLSGGSWEEGLAAAREETAAIIREAQARALPATEPTASSGGQGGNPRR